jgi:hypothetical protein
VDPKGVTQSNTNGGVRAEFNLTANGLSQFSNGVGSVYISAFELNFPNTDLTDGYDTNAAGGLGNNWTNVSGVGSVGGVEWQEGGRTNGWGEFGQEINWGAGTGSGVLTQNNGSSVIDFYNGLGLDNISVASIIANAVANIDGVSAPAYSWIKVRSNVGLPADRGLAGTGWWGNSTQNNATATGRYQLDILATSYVDNLVAPSQVPVPAALPLMASAIGAFGLTRKRSTKTGR